MRLLTIFLLVILAACSSIKKTECNYITDYYQTIYQADYEFETANYQQAFNLYQQAFNSCTPINTYTYNEIGKFTETSAILKKFDITYIYAKKQVDHGVEISRFQNNSKFEEFFTTKYGKKFITEYQDLREKFLATANLKLRDELIAMRSADQLYRVQGRKGDWTKQDSIDKRHKKRLIEIFESIGYPTENIVGPSTTDFRFDVGLLLLHTKDSIRINYFVPKLKKFVQNGTASPLNLGTIIDQFYLYNNEPQIYGTYGAQGGGYANMIPDLKKVDSNRISIGLPTLELQQKKDSLARKKFGL